MGFFLDYESGLLESDPFYDLGFTSGGGGSGVSTTPDWMQYLPSVNLNLGSAGGITGARAADPRTAAVSALNQAEAALQQNLQQFMDGPRSSSAQQEALGRFDNIWNQVVTLLSDSRLGSWGSNGLAERSRGGRYDWAAYYRDPIANTQVQMDVAGLGAGLTRASQQSWFLPVVIIALLGLILFLRLR